MGLRFELFKQLNKLQIPTQTTAITTTTATTTTSTTLTTSALPLEPNVILQLYYVLNGKTNFDRTNEYLVKDNGNFLGVIGCNKIGPSTTPTRMKLDYSETLGWTISFIVDGRDGCQNQTIDGSVFSAEKDRIVFSTSIDGAVFRVDEVFSV